LRPAILPALQPARHLKKSAIPIGKYYKNNDCEKKKREMWWMANEKSKEKRQMVKRVKQVVTSMLAN
jgi:hypothetical protein